MCGMFIFSLALALIIYIYCDHCECSGYSLSQWLSRYEDGFCLNNTQRSQQADSLDQCIPNCLFGAGVCYGVSFNTATGDCKISNSDSVDSCSENDLIVFTSAEAAPNTTTISTTTTTSITSTTTTPPTTPTTSTSILTTSSTTTLTTLTNISTTSWYPELFVYKIQNVSKEVDDQDDCFIWYNYGFNHYYADTAESADTAWYDEIAGSDEPARFDEPAGSLETAGYNDTAGSDATAGSNNNGCCVEWGKNNEEPHVILDMGSSVQNTVKQIVLYRSSGTAADADTLSDLLIELANSTSQFDNNPGEYMCTTTSGPATSNPYIIACDNFYYERYLKIGRPNATASEYLCMEYIGVNG